MLVLSENLLIWADFKLLLPYKSWLWPRTEFERLHTPAGGCCGRRGGSLLKYWFGSCPGRCGQTTLLRVRNIYISSKYSNPHLKLTQCPSCTNTWKLGSYLMNSIIFINGSNYSEFRVRITLLSLLPSSLLTNIISIPRTTRLGKIKTNVNGEFKTV